MKNIFITLLLGIILSSTLAKAESIFQYSVTGEIFKNDTAHYELNIIFINQSSQTVTIPLGSSTNIQIESTTECREQRGTLETFVICSMANYEKINITIKYNSNTVSKRDNYFLFTNSFRLPDNTKTISVLIKLPEGTGLREPIEDSYTPSDALIGSDGRRPIINWLKNDLRSGERFDISIAFEKIGETTASFPFEIILVIILILFSSLGIFYQFYWRNKNIKLILPVLKKDEKIIFDTIMKHGSSVNQKIIVKESGYSKAKVSKVLNSLKERRLIKLERIGRSNKVYIEKNFEKKS